MGVLDDSRRVLGVDLACRSWDDIGSALVVALFRELVRRANAGEAVGVSYKGFVEHVHGASFDEVQGRPWSQSDTSGVLHLANQITGAAGGSRCDGGMS